MKIALTGYKVQHKYNEGATNDEDTELLAFLNKKGLDVSAAVWNDPGTDWANYDVVVLKSTWDYHDHITEFYEWLDKLKQLQLKVLNPVDIIKWNSNKHYLKEIADKGFPVIPSLFLKDGSFIDERLFSHFSADELVVKPCVSAGAKNTITLTRPNIADQSAHLESLLTQEDYLVQPFVKEINEGEWSFLFFNGRYSHCILKTPKPGDFRVQQHHGGSISLPKPKTKHIDQAEKFVSSFAVNTLYARVDGVLVKNDFQLMELELIEPYLFLNNDETLMERYYQALINLI